MAKFSKDQKQLRSEYAKEANKLNKSFSRLIKSYNVPEQVYQKYKPKPLKQIENVTKEQVEELRRINQSKEYTKTITKTIYDFATGDKKDIPYNEYIRTQRVEAGKRGAKVTNLNKSKDSWYWKKGENDEIIYSDKAEQLFLTFENNLSSLINFISSSSKPNIKDKNETRLHAIGRFLKEAYEKAKRDNPKKLLLTLDIEKMHLEELFERIFTEYLALSDPSCAAHEIYYIITGDYSETTAKNMSEQMNPDNTDIPDNTEDLDEEDLDEIDFPW